jgi:hypothetical protein
MVAPCATLASMAVLSDLADRLESAARALAAMGPDIEAAGPWPLAEQFGVEPEASWGPPELLAHVSEMVPYWLGEIERILAAAPSADPVPFGRVSGDATRIAIIGRDRTIPVPELLARIVSESTRAAARLREVDGTGEGGGAGRSGLHPRIGVMTLPDIAERFLAAHAEEHVLQLRDILAAAG